jgi:hypothetical protein
MKTKPLDVQGTATLQASLRAHNHVLREENGLWASLTMRSSDTSRIMEAQKNVKLAFEAFLTTKPDAKTADVVKAWLVANARDPGDLLERLNASY